MKIIIIYLFEALLLIFLTSCGLSDTNWTSIGPDKEIGQSDFLPCAGRIDAIAVSEDFDGRSNSAMYIAGPGMGVWRSNDFESSEPRWVPLTDHILIGTKFPYQDLDFRQDINHILSLAVDPTNPKRIYAGTATSHSVILRSDDGGAHWSVINRTAFNNNVGANKLIVNPAGYLYVIGAGGVWKESTPAGNTFINLATQGVNPPMGDVEFHDAVFMPAGLGHPAVLYVAIIDRNSANRDRTGIWSYIAGTWTKMNINMLNIQGLPFFKPDINRIKMAFREGAGVVAALASDNGKLRDLQGSFLNVFKLHRQILGGNLSWEPAWSDPVVFINTQASVNDMGTCIDHNGIIYSGGIGVYHSDGNGGVVHCLPSVTPGSYNIHVDEHMIMEYNDKIYVATDGGLFRFSSNDNPQSGKHQFESLNTNTLRNFLTTSVDRGKIEGDHLTGNWDNGIVHITCNEGCKHRKRSNEGEIVRFAPNQTNPKNETIAYSFGIREGFYKSNDGGQSFAETGLPVTLVNGIYCFHQSTKGRMLLNVTLKETIDGKPTDVHTVYETMSDWTDTPRDILNQTVKKDGSPTAMCYAGDNIIIAASGRIHVSPDDGATWTMVYSSNARVVDIYADPSNPNEIYYATDYFFKPGSVFHATLVITPAVAFTNVTSLTGDLPGEVNQLALMTRGEGKKPHLYVTLNNHHTNAALGGPGVYEMKYLDGNQFTWTKVGKGLPDAMAMDLHVSTTKPGSGILMVALWGRGAWEIAR